MDDAGARATGERLSAWERGAHGLSALLAVCALAFWPVVRAVDPSLAVVCLHADGSTERTREAVRLQRPDRWAPGEATSAIVDPSSNDPWGRPWRVRWAVRVAAYRFDRGSAYSTGPDGLDDLGGGDDMAAHDAFDHPLYWAMPDSVLGAPALSLALAALGLSVWTRLTRSAIRALRGGLPAEVLRAAVMVAAPAVAVGPWLVGEVSALEGPLLLVAIDPRLALALTWAALVFLPAFAWRLSRDPRPAFVLSAW